MITPSMPMSTEEVSDHYDSLDLMYREIWGDHVHHGLYHSIFDSITVATERLTHRIAELGGIHSGSKVCDVGCGYGATSRLLSEAYHADVTAITISKAQYEYALCQVQPIKPVRYLHGDWLKLALPDNDYDTLIAIESSEHMEDLSSFYEQAFRVLRPGGKIVVAAWLSNEHASEWSKKHLLTPICTEGRLFSMASENDHRALIQRTGFSEIACEDISHSVRQTWSVCIPRFLWKVLTKPGYRSSLLSSAFTHRIFAITIFRIWLAYYLGAMRYGLIQATKPD